MKQQPNFSFETCSHEDAVKLLTIPADLRHIRTLDCCHWISGVRTNVQLARGLQFKHCSSIYINFSDIECFLSALEDQTNTGKRFYQPNNFMTYIQLTGRIIS